MSCFTTLTVQFIQSHNTNCPIYPVTTSLFCHTAPLKVWISTGEKGAFYVSYSLRLSIDVGLCVKVSTSNQVLPLSPWSSANLLYQFRFWHTITKPLMWPRFNALVKNCTNTASRIPSSFKLQTSLNKKDKYVETNSKSKNIVLIFYLNFTFTLHGLLAYKTTSIAPLPSRNIRSFHRGRRWGLSRRVGVQFLHSSMHLLRRWLMVFHTHHENEYPWNLKSKICEKYSMNKFRSSSTNHFSFSFHPSDFSSSFFPNTLLPLSHPTQSNTLQPTKPDQTRPEWPDTLWFPKAVILAIRRRWATAAAPFLCRCWFKACCRASEVAASLQMACKPREPKRLSCAPVMVEGRRTSPSQKKKLKLGFLGCEEKVSFFFEFSVFFFKLAFEKNLWLVCRCSCFISILVNHVFLSVRAECTCLTQKDQSYQHDTTKGFIYSVPLAEKSNMEMKKIILSRNCKK